MPPIMKSASSHAKAEQDSRLVLRPTQMHLPDAYTKELQLPDAHTTERGTEFIGGSSVIKPRRTSNERSPKKRKTNQNMKAWLVSDLAEQERRIAKEQARLRKLEQQHKKQQKTAEYREGRNNERKGEERKPMMYVRRIERILERLRQQMFCKDDYADYKEFLMRNDPQFANNDKK